MTRTEAREWFENALNNNDFFPETEEAFKIAIEALSVEPTVIRSKTLMPTKDFKEWAKRVREVNPNVTIIPCDAVVVSADAVPSEQYKKGFEDAKRAFELEYARESENMRKRNAQLEVMLNAQKAISADAEWIPVSERLPSMRTEVIYSYDGIVSTGYITDRDCIGEKTEEHWEDLESGAYIEPIAWMPLPKPYREENEE